MFEYSPIGLYNECIKIGGKVIMYTEISNKLEKSLKGIYRLQKIDTMLMELQGEQENLKVKVSELRKILEKENLDVNKLNNKSIVSVFYSVIGKLEDRLDEEQREALAAKLKYDQAINDLENIKYDISRLSQERNEYLNCKEQYESLFAQKKELLIKSNTATSNRIIEITEQLNDSKNRLNELTEAIYAGKDAIRSLENALNSLDNAEGWGTWDLLGGGLLADIAKHSELDNSRQEIEIVQNKLRRFKTELADVNINSDIHIETDGFAKFADFFFDGLISDWFMQSKINESQKSVLYIKDQVESAVLRLIQLKSQETDLVARLEEELNKLIIKS